MEVSAEDLKIEVGHVSIPSELLKALLVAFEVPCLWTSISYDPIIMYGMPKLYEIQYIRIDVVKSAIGNGVMCWSTSLEW
jgi:hypothetical protein